MKKSYLNTIRFEDECTNWHVGELALKYNEIKLPKLKISDVIDAISLLRDSIDPEVIQIQEYFYAIYMNNQRDVLGFKTISIGSVAGAVINIPLILSIGLILNAKNIIVAHNHPSGNLIPSDNDIKMTSQLYSATKIVDMNLIDHIILTRHSYNSMCESMPRLFRGK